MTTASTPNASGERSSRRPSNEYVLNIAFLSFLVFTALQFVFAYIAHSQSMLTDCAAMTVDVISYFINYVAETFKVVGQRGHNERTVLYLELVPPLFSVLTLVIVTTVALYHSISTLLAVHNDDPPDYYDDDRSTTKNNTTTTTTDDLPTSSSLHYHHHNDDDDPNIGLMLLFSTMNLVLDILNVSCFARTEFVPLMTNGRGNSTTTQTTIAYGTADDDNHNGIPTTHSLYRKPVVTATTERSKLLETEETTNGRHNHHHHYHFWDHLHEIDDPSSSSSSSVVLRNLNMCSAWTHVCADTLRSVAVLVAAGLATFLPDQISPIAADSNGTIVVSLVILVSLGPLLHGLYRTAYQIVSLERTLNELDRV